MVPFKPYFVGEEVAAVAPGHLGPEVLPDRRTSTSSAPPSATAPSSRCSGTSASATTSSPMPSPWRGSCSPRCSVWTPIACGSRCTSPTTRPSRSGWTAPGCPRPAFSRWARTTSGRWATVGPCGPSSELFYRPGPRLRRRRWSRPRWGRALRRDLQPRLHAVQPAGRRHSRGPPRQEHRHRGRARTQPPHAPGGGVALRDRRLSSHPGRGRRDDRSPLRRRSPFRRHPAHPGRSRPGHGHGGGRRRAAVERGPGLCAAPHHPAGGATGASSSA